MSIIKRKNKWWVDFGYQGRRYRQVSPENSRNGARAYESLLRQKLVKGEDIITKIKKRKTLEEFVPIWIESYVKVNNKPSEIKNKTTYLRSCLLPFFGKKRLDEISSLDIEKFKAHQLKKVKPKTVNNQLGTLAKCLKTAIEWEELDKMPLIKPLRCDPEEFDFLSQEESQKLLNSAHGSYYTAILLALHTGMRLGELMALNWTSINFSNNQIVVKQTFSNGILGSTKSNKIRYIPMTSDLRDHLFSLKPKEGFVLKGPDGIRFRPECSRTVLEEICKKAKLRKIGWHKLRHTFASHLVEKGVTMVAVKDLMGHSDIKTTMQYAHLGQHTLRDAIKTLETPVNINSYQEKNKVRIFNNYGF
jgi:integrase